MIQEGRGTAGWDLRGVKLVGCLLAFPRLSMVSTPRHDPQLKPLPRLLFISRWLQLPLYLGLIVAQARPAHANGRYNGGH
jgi:hypothetical protein